MKFAPEGPLTCTHIGLQVQAAIDGLGYMMNFEEYTRHAVREGRLEPVLEDWCPPFPGPFLYYPSRRQPPPALAAFIRFVAERRRKK